MEIRYSFALNEAQVPVKPSLLCLDDCQAFDLPGGMVMLLGRYSGKRLAVTRDVFIALQACNEFRTLDEHVAYLLQRMPELAAQPADVKRVLESIRDAGLFIDARRIASAIRRQNSRALGPLTVAILTCDRPVALERLLDSMTISLEHDLLRCVLIIDDSRQPSNVLANQAIVARHSGRSRLPAVQHINATWRADYLRKLAAKIPEAEASMPFLLDAGQWPEHRRYGLARNWALLLAAGTRLAMFDDDVLCEAVGPAVDQPALSFTRTPRQAYECTLPSMLAVSTRSQNPLTLLGQVLGNTLGAVLDHQRSSGLQAEQLRGAALPDVIALSSDTPILVTACGTWGDPGTGPTVNWLMGLPDHCLEPLAHDEHELQRFLASRDFWMGRPQPTVTSRFFMSGLTGLDTRVLLPPYFPVMRGEDLLFGCLLALLYPEARVLDFDWAVPHRPVDSREHLSRSTVNPPEVSIALLEETLMAWAPLLSGTPAERLQQVAAAMRQLIELPTEALLSVAEAELLGRRVNSLNELTRRQTQWPQAALAWRQLVEDAIQRHQQALMQSGLVAQMAASRVADDAALIAQFREWASSYADALRHWPAIWQASLAESAGRDSQP